MKWLLALALLAPAARAEKEKPSAAAFAVIVGLNASPNSELAPLRYADDDAARYQELFRTLGARTYLLTRLDEASKRLSPQAAAESREPRLGELERVLSELAEDIRQAHRRGVETDFYFIYAGHGTVEDGRGFITFEDGRMDGEGLEQEIAARVPATRKHFIIDACYSYFLAYGRGPGGQRRELRGFNELSGLLKDSRVGLLLSTSSARESHEWEGFQAGVFSHEVRSGLYGAADSDGDGQVSYREIAAFIARANQPILNERYRSDVLAKPPRESGDQLIDLKLAGRPALEVDGRLSGHYLVEDGRGVRIADFHNGDRQTLKLLRPGAKSLYVRRLSDGVEYKVPAGDGITVLAELPSAPGEVSSRGAAHEAFTQLFAFPFDRKVVAQFDLSDASEALEVKEAGPPFGARRWAGVGTFTAGLGAAIAGGVLTVNARQLRAGTPDTASQAEVLKRNDQLTSLNRMSAILYGAAGAAVAAGALLMFLPTDSPAAQLSAGITPTGARFSFGGRF